MEKPSYNYNRDQENAWAFYNHVTSGLKTAHPRTWLSDTGKFHKFISADLLGNMGIQNIDTVDLSKFETLNDPELIDINDSDILLNEPINENISSVNEHQMAYLGRN